MGGAGSAGNQTVSVVSSASVSQNRPSTLLWRFPFFQRGQAAPMKLLRLHRVWMDAECVSYHGIIPWWCCPPHTGFEQGALVCTLERKTSTFPTFRVASSCRRRGSSQNLARRTWADCDCMWVAWRGRGHPSKFQSLGRLLPSPHHQRKSRKISWMLFCCQAMEYGGHSPS